MDRIIKLKAFLERQPNDSFLKHALALEFVKLQDDATARMLFDEILATDPGYIGSYYHLAKLLERQGETTLAAAVYERGVAVAIAAGDNHSKNELQMALDELTD
ncbi:MAG: hypothetical protein V4717_13490 [Bacteroidota bacterium]